MKNIMNVLIKPKEQSNEYQTTWEEDYMGFGYTEYDDVLECGCCACCGCTCYEEKQSEEDDFIDDYERQNEQAKEFMKILRSK